MINDKFCQLVSLIPLGKTTVKTYMTRAREPSINYSGYPDTHFICYESLLVQCILNMCLLCIIKSVRVLSLSEKHSSSMYFSQCMAYELTRLLSGGGEPVWVQVL